jgi:hypothetical protein
MKDEELKQVLAGEGTNDREGKQWGWRWMYFVYVYENIATKPVEIVVRE